MHKKYIAFSGRVLPINNNVVIGAGFRNKSGAKNIINEITHSMGGMLISNSNVYKGKGMSGPERKRPIRFVI